MTQQEVIKFLESSQQFNDFVSVVPHECEISQEWIYWNFFKNICSIAKKFNKKKLQCCNKKNFDENNAL